MATNPAAGDYFVVNSQSGLCMTVDVDSAKDGANILLRSYDSWNGQVFTLSYREDGTVRLVNRHSGKSVDVAKVQANANIQQWSASGSRAQGWLLDSTGLTMTFKGQTLDTFWLDAETDDTKSAAANGTIAGSNIQLADKGGVSATAQHWAFWPVPDLVSGGIYELLSAVDTTTCAQIQSNSASSGARLVIGDADGGNGDKFWLSERDGGGWTIVNAASGYALGVVASTPTVGALVTQQPTSSGYDNQKWEITTVGETTIDGNAYPIVEVGCYLATDPTTYVLDSHLRDSTSDARVVMNTGASTNSQRWVLMPTTLSGSIPVPANVSMTAAVGDSPAQTMMAWADTVYPCWDCTDGWATSGPNHFEYRWQSAFLSQSDTWNFYQYEMDWKPVAAAYDGTRVWLADGIAPTLPSGAKAVRHTFYVRCVGQSSYWDWWSDPGNPHEVTVDVVGPYASGFLTLYVVPDFDLLVAGMSPEGLRLEYGSDYDAGRCNLYVTSVANTTTGFEYLTGGEQAFSSLDQSGSVLIPYSQLQPITEGTPLTVTYQIGTDVLRRMSETYTADLTAHHVSGWDDGYYDGHAEPTVALSADRMHIVATLEHLGTERLWVDEGGRLKGIKGRQVGTNTVFEIPYAFGQSVGIYTTATDDTGDVWGTYYVLLDSIIGGLRPCHAFNWDGGSFYLEHQIGEPLAVERSLTPVHEAHVLNKRAREAVTYARTTKGSFKVSGVLLFGHSESTIDDLLALVDEGRHVTYRSPRGEVCQVAVTAASYTRYKQYAAVEVSVTEETV